MPAPAALRGESNDPSQDGRALAGALESEEQKRDRLDKLDAIGQALAKTRSEAIQGRQQSGIEQDWHEDEEFYQGIDDANRSEHRSIWHTKPMGQAAPMTGMATRSTVFPNITGPYCDAAAARIADMLLPTDDRSWAIKPTPIPELVALAKGEVSHEIHQAALADSGGDAAQAGQQVQTAVDAAQALLDKAKAQADKAQKRIEDWHVECQFHSHVRVVIEDSARLGTGVLKGPVPNLKKSVAFLNGALAVNQAIKPGSKRVDVWNFFPDPACGENIQNGAYTWERDRITRKQLRDLKKQPGYIAENIDLCLEEGSILATAAESTSSDTEHRFMSDAEKRGKYEIWYYHGTMERDDLVAAGVDLTDTKDPHLPAMVTMVNTRVVRAALNPLDTGSYPYDVMVWRPRANHWTGIGVARQIRTPQRIVVAATRNLMDNAGIAAGPMIVLRQGVVTPADGVMGIAPRKVWYIAEDADEVLDAKNAFGVVQIEMLVNELMEIIKLGLKLAEDVTGMPLLLQGQQGKAPDTVGGLLLLHNNATAVLRRLARLFDDRVTEPHVTRYYEWLLQYGEDDEKGDYVIDARGSSALVERDIQNQELGGIVKLSLDMRFGLDPRKAAQEYLKSRHFDPKSFEFDDEKWKSILDQMSKKPEDRSMAIAQLRAATEEKLAGFWAHQEQVQKQLEQQFEQAENARDRALEMWVRELEDTGTRTITLDEIKAKLAGETIRAEAENARTAAERGHKTVLELAKPKKPDQSAPVAQ